MQWDSGICTPTIHVLGKRYTQPTKACRGTAVLAVQQYVQSERSTCSPAVHAWISEVSTRSGIAVLAVESGTCSLAAHAVESGTFTPAVHAVESGACKEDEGYRQELERAKIHLGERVRSETENQQKDEDVRSIGIADLRRESPGEERPGESTRTAFNERYREED